MIGALKKPVLLETPRLVIRSIREDDIAALYTKIFGDEEVMRFISSGVSRTLEHATSRIHKIMEWERRFGMSFWAVLRRDTGELIGNCGLVPVEGKGPEIELGYDTATAFWRQGYTSEAALASLRYGFETLKLDRIIAVCDPLNTGSWKVMAKIGMTRVGLSDKYYGLTSLVYDSTPAGFSAFHSLLR